MISVSSDFSWLPSLRYLMRMFCLTLHCFPCVCFGKDLESNCFTDWGTSMMFYANQCCPTGTSSSSFWTSILGYVLENDLMLSPINLLHSTVGIESISKWLREGALLVPAAARYRKLRWSYPGVYVCILLGYDTFLITRSL